MSSLPFLFPGELGKLSFCCLHPCCLLSLLKASHKIFLSQTFSPRHLNLSPLSFPNYSVSLVLSFCLSCFFSSVLPSATPAVQGPFPLWPSPWLTTTAPSRSSWDGIFSLSLGDVRTFLYQIFNKCNKDKSWGETLPPDLINSFSGKHWEEKGDQAMSGPCVRQGTGHYQSMNYASHPPLWEGSGSCLPHWMAGEMGRKASTQFSDSAAR